MSSWNNINTFRDITYKQIQTPQEIIRHIQLFGSLNLYDQNYKKLEFNFTQTHQLLMDMAAAEKDYSIIKYVEKLDRRQEAYTFTVCSLNVILLISLNINSLLSTQFNPKFKLVLGIIFQLMCLQLVFQADTNLLQTRDHVLMCH